jgi:ubiquinone/menaquinone biosynthesis C-methylase UbiE
MSTGFAGDYPIEHSKAEIERLHMQGAAMAPDAAAMLDRIGVGPGWRCLDVGCGPRGITDLISQRVGPSGRVVGLDMNEQFLQHARARASANVEFRAGDAYGSNLAGGSFDLVHMRFVASTTRDPEGLLREAIRLARPGGVVALQEPDVATLNCYPPHPAWDRLRSAIFAVFANAGTDIYLARRLYALARDAGLEDVAFRPFLVGVRSTDPMVDFLPATAETLRGTMLHIGAISESELAASLDECRRHLRQPDTIFTTYTVAQVWGRKPG